MIFPHGLYRWRSVKLEKVTEGDLSKMEGKIWGDEPVEVDGASHVEVPNWSDKDYAYLVEWNTISAPRTLQRLHASKILVKVATESFTVQRAIADGAKEARFFAAGTLMIPLGLQSDRVDAVRSVLEEAVLQDGVRVSTVASGLTDVGIDLGSDGFKRLSAPKVLLVVGAGVSDYDAGEVWHHFDQRLSMPITMVDAFQLGSIKLESYTHIITVSGTYTSVPASATDSLQAWLKSGGTWIATGTSAQWLNQRKISSFSIRKREGSVPQRMPYAQASDNAVVNEIDGAIFSTEVDRTHPIAFGIESDELPCFEGTPCS